MIDWLVGIGLALIILAAPVVIVFVGWFIRGLVVGLRSGKAKYWRSWD